MNQQATRPSLSVEQLREMDHVIIVDRSDSMNEPVRKGSATSRWESMQESLRTITKDALQADKDGIQIAFFNNNITPFQIVTDPLTIGGIFSANSPRNGTALAPVIQALRQLRDRNNGKPIIATIFTDGEPNDKADARAAIIDLANSQANDADLSLNFVQVGDVEAAGKYLKDLDNNLKGAAKFDIVNAMTQDEADNSTYGELCYAALHD